MPEAVSPDNAIATAWSDYQTTRVDARQAHT
jgi:hypothetical protein